MYSTYAGWPPMVTDVPSSAVGALLPLKSVVAHARSELYPAFDLVFLFSSTSALLNRPLLALPHTFVRE